MILLLSWHAQKQRLLPLGWHSWCFSISSLTSRKWNHQLTRALMVDGDLVEMQNPLPYSLSLQDVVVSKGLQWPFVLCSQIRLRFLLQGFSVVVSRNWVLPCYDCYATLVLVQYVARYQEERKKRKKKRDKSRFHEGSVLLPVILIYSWKDAWYNHLFIERSKVRNKGRGGEDEREKGLRRREGRTKRIRDCLENRISPQLGLSLRISWKAFQRVMIFTLQACCQFLCHLCCFVPKGGNGELCLPWVCIANVITFVFS